MGTKVLAFRKGEAAPVRHAISVSGGTVAVKDENTVELRDTIAGERAVALSDGSSRAVTIGALPSAISPGTWRLEIDGVSASGAPYHSLQLDALKPWNQLPGLGRVAGVGTYTTKVELPADWVAPARGVLLDLGTVEGIARVTVNGQAAARGSLAGAQVDVSGLLRAGANELRVRVATTLRNAVPLGFQMPGQPAPPPNGQAYGLVGPVTLVPFGRATVDLRAPGTPPVERPPVVTPPARRPSTKVTVKAGKAIRLAGLSKKGLLVQVTVPQRAKLALTLTAKLPRAKRTTTLARASRSTSKAATVTVRLKATRAAARRLELALKAKKRVTATIAIKTTLAGGKPTTKRLKVTIRR